MSEPYKTISYKGFTIEIHFDNDPLNPIKDWDMLGKFVCWHNRYDLGNCKDFAEPDKFHEFIKREKPFVLPLYMYEHSGITISTSNAGYPFDDRWDSGQLGYVFVTREDVRR